MTFYWRQRKKKLQDLLGICEQDIHKTSMAHHQPEEEKTKIRIGNLFHMHAQKRRYRLYAYVTVFAR